TWWNHRGSKEWVQYDFDQAREVSEVEVYWFDDTGIGQCRIPRSWRVLHRENDSWKPVPNAVADDVTKDQWNRMRFETVRTMALRIEVDLQPGFSGGILEWRVK